METIYQIQAEESLDVPFFFTAKEYLTEKRVEELKRYFQTAEITPTGSRHIEHPAKLGTDDDYLIYLRSPAHDMEPLRKKYVEDGWVDCLAESCPGGFERYKVEGLPLNMWGAFLKGEVNAIVYLDKYLYDASCQATKLCQKLNIRDKERRIRVFRWYKFEETLQKGDLF